MAAHSVVFNMRVQLPGSAKDTPGQVPYEAMMATFDRTRADGVKEGWQLAMNVLRDVVAAEAGQDELLNRWIRLAADSARCPDFS